MRTIGWIAGLAALCISSCAHAQSPDLARKLTEAAAQGSAEASYHLGMLYNNGIGVEQDAKVAFTHFLKAAEGGDPLGAYKAGCYYAGQFGDAVPADEERALAWKVKAAEAGYKLAQLEVGIAYARRGDHDRALPWFEAASRQGEPQALYNLSFYYKDGLGTAPSRPKSYAFFRLAHLAAKGSVSEAAKKSLEEMARPMSSEERAEADRLASTWITGPTFLTRLAVGGLERAELVARAAR